MTPKNTFAVVVGNRGFFPDHLADEGRKDILRVLEQEGFGAICLTPEDTPFGSVETREHAKACARLFQKHADDIDGVIVTLPNFGDERGVAEALRMSGLGVPVLIQATPDDPRKLTLADRRDSFCGKMSACNNLRQYEIDFSLTASHTVAPDSDEFRADLQWFGAVCRVTNALSSARFGAIGPAPPPSTPSATARRSSKPTASPSRS